MSISSKLRASLLCATSIAALAPAVRAQDAATETVVVTGSRVIADAVNSPTPLTIVTAAQLQATTPGDIPDGLNKLPVFIGSGGTNRQGAGGSNGGGNVLNLRNFGAQRTLTLFDGHRVAPSTIGGSVNVDILPQALMSRVDVVTGGASAVYGSDAVTGVVNFVLDTRFTGFKYNALAGISNYADGAKYSVSLAAGSDILGGRGHIEAEARHYHSDLIRLSNRPGEIFHRWLLTGAGTAANPFVQSRETRYGQFTFGGLVTCTGTTANPCAANQMQFVAPGVLGYFNPGTPTGTNGTPTGGDAAWTTNATIASLFNSDDVFLRGSYNLDDNTSFYIQATVAQSYNWSHWTNNYLQTALTAPHTFFKNNPFLPAATQAILAGGNTSTFTMTEYIIMPNNQGQTTRAITGNQSLAMGLDGVVSLFNGHYDWDLYYSHSIGRQEVDDPRNQKNDKMTAALDAVLVGGRPVCYVSTTIYANLYPGCVPMNPFGPGVLTQEQYDYWAVDSHFINITTMDEFSASIAGEVLELPAGPVKVAISGEYRTTEYGVMGNSPTSNIDCTGLRNCNPNTPMWQAATVTPQPFVSGSVWELGIEGEIPLINDVPLIQSLSINTAGRFTNYSTSGAVQTWKLGIDYHVNDDVRFRATNSVDIRAPTLDDLFGPVQKNPAGFVDLHSGGTSYPVIPAQSQGNPNLVPEVARTYTAGVVFTPSFIPGLTVSADYYTLALKNAIGSINGTNATIQQICETSGGTSPYCSLYVRPLPFSDHTTFNAPIVILSLSLNTALNQAEGWDMEMNYNFEMEDLIDGANGSMNIRLLANDQVSNFSVAYSGAPTVRNTVPKGRFTTFVGYKVGNWNLNLQDRWYAGYPRSAQPGVIIYAPPDVRAKSKNYVDLNVTRTFMYDETPVDVFFSVENLINTPPPVVITAQNGPNLGSWGGGSAAGTDTVGRYFTIGIRGKL